ncbi:MAG: AAA family ATPase, partial [Candidatus Baltobacteraceae bacterium]
MRQIILAGPPGTSKTFVAQQLVKYFTRGDKTRSHLVQFHPSYSYEQFVEGLRPTVVNGAIQFKPEPGIVLDLAEKCRTSADDHFLIIDEFNRANLSRVLGEL